VNKRDINKRENVGASMKFCFNCKKEIADDAVFCPSCGTILNQDKKAKEKWYLNTTSLIVSFLCVGPFMLPLVWLKPELSTKTKIIYTAVILILSYLIFVVFMKSLKSVLSAYKFAATM
jgi:uncharacterized membrane protein YvbJ